MGAPALFTVGHGTRTGAELAAALQAEGVELLVDVRRFPASRRDPSLTAEALARTVGSAGVDYRWEQDLGGRRHLPGGIASPDPWWTVPAFRAYAAHTRTEAFRAALERVLRDAGSRQVAVLCSETAWWRCHRRLIADVAVLAHHRRVLHLLPGPRAMAHQVAAGARLTGPGLVVWDVLPRPEP